MYYYYNKILEKCILQKKVASTFSTQKIIFNIAQQINFGARCFVVFVGGENFWRYLVLTNFI